MTRYPPRMIAVATGLAMLAGMVDAYAFASLGGFFASFMSGNSTRMGVSAIAGRWDEAMIAASLLLAFLAGVIAAAVVARAAAGWRKPAVMALTTALILAGGLLAAQGWGALTLVALAAAMGAENGVFVRDGEVAIGVTYFTGTLVKLGQKLAAALMGEGPRWDWVPNFILWIGFLGGGLTGAWLFATRGADALWFAGGAAAAMTLVLAAMARDRAGTATAG